VRGGSIIDFHVRNKRFEVEEEEGVGTDILEEEEELPVAMIEKVKRKF
jgi:hypothetical protein